MLFSVSTLFCCTDTENMQAENKEPLWMENIYLVPGKEFEPERKFSAVC